MTSEATLVGIDVGGTFTDFVVLDGAGLRVHKVPTTPDDQSRAIVAGLEALGIDRTSLDAAQIVHGMTVATNALLERRGAKTGLLTTRGFGDVLVIGRQNRPFLYRLSQTRPPSLVADEWRREVDERLDAAGEVVTPLDEDAVARLAAELAQSDVQSLAIVFLHAFRNPDHERRAAVILRERLPDLPLSLSSEILPEYREYERTATTVINAYVQPLVARYLARLDKALPGSHVRIMQSNGGAIGLAQAADQAARLVLSGPAGGVVGAFALAQSAGVSSNGAASSDTASNNTVSNNAVSNNTSNNGAAPQLITFNMGGTSTDVALCPGAIPTTAESLIDDLPLRLPLIDIHTVGAGGGSIAYVDVGGALRVGPRSAGAVPGPACYGRGGQEPTVTDANLVLGRLDPQGFLGGHGEVGLDEGAARRVLQQLGQALDLSVEAAALGVIRIANATMERALRRVSVERGYDPRQFTLVPFGGAGPMHACGLADALSIRRILIPPFPGVLSAYGMLAADVVYDASQTIWAQIDRGQDDLSPLSEQLTEQLTNAVAALAQRVRTVLAQDGIDAPQLEALLDLRYRGQSYELTVPLALPVDGTSVSRSALQGAVEAFHAAHARRYGYAMPDEPVEVVTLRLVGRAPGVAAALPERPAAGPDPQAAYLGERSVWFAPDAATPVPVYRRDRLQPGNRLHGPALVLQYDATVVIAPHWQGEIDPFGNLILTHTLPQEAAQ